MFCLYHYNNTNLVASSLYSAVHARTKQLARNYTFPTQPSSCFKYESFSSSTITAPSPYETGTAEYEHRRSPLYSIFRSNQRLSIACQISQAFDLLSFTSFWLAIGFSLSIYPSVVSLTVCSWSLLEALNKEPHLPHYHKPNEMQCDKGVCPNPSASSTPQAHLGHHDYGLGTCAHPVAFS